MKKNTYLIDQLSVFFPVYNEEENVVKTITDSIAVLKKIVSKWEVVVVNDGSTDNTVKLVKSLLNKYPQIRLVNHQVNRGYGAAIKTGLQSSRYNWIAYTDSDGQFDFREINNFLPLSKTADLIIGYRKARTDSSYRRLLAKILQVFNIVVFGLNLRDVDCGFKLFKKEVVDRIGRLKTESAITETEFMIRAQRAGFKITQVGVSHHIRIDGEQTGGKFRVLYKAGWEAIKLWFILLTQK